ncbi:cation diffusion facilitator family transporter [Prolixibacter bellariivorans]|nr:cation diffusion facilitator family transporter [Prolixibacter bellariivorans]
MRSKNTRMIVTAGWVSVIVNLVLFALKYWAGIVSGSIAIVADAWHTLSDSVSSIIVIFGATLAGKPADDEHPFGHGRAEHIAAVIIGVLLAIIAFEFLLQSVDRLRSHTAVHYGMVAKVVTVVSILAKEGLAQYAFGVGRKAQSSVLKADGWHHRSDALSSIIILVGIFLGGYFWWIDGVLGILVAILIAYTAYEVMKNDFSLLLGESADPTMIAQIRELVDANVDREVYPHHFHMHRYGHHTELSCHIKLPPEMTLDEAHHICSIIEDAIEKELGIMTTIHPEPLTMSNED